MYEKSCLENTHKVLHVHIAENLIEVEYSATIVAHTLTVIQNK
jgi:hypothetical protein